MKNFARLVTIVLVLTLALGTLAACGSKDGDSGGTGKEGSNASATPINLKLWGSQEDQEMLGQMIESFKAAHTDATYNIELGVVSEADGATRYAEDPSAAADVFAFASDQIRTLTNAGGLYEVTRNKAAVTSANTDSSIDAATIDGKLYAYPMTADNGYFLYYDKSVVSEDAVKSLDGILAAAASAGKKVFMDVSNGWYIASFFLGAGGTLGIDASGKQICDFNNANGVAAGEAIKVFTADPQFLTGDDSILTAGFDDRTIVAGVSGSWNQEAIKASLGADFGATKLPTFTVNGAQKQMGSFAGFKLVGVNSQTQSPVAAMELAEWITNEQNQALRFSTRGLGPSNKNVAASSAVQNDVVLAALAYQNQFGTSQKDVLGSYWGPAEAFGTAMETKDYSKSIQDLLDIMVSQIAQ